MKKKEIFDLIIIGGGPTGMFAAYYAGMRELNTKLIESLPKLGGQIELMYPEKVIQDIGAVPKIKGKQLISNLKEQLASFPTDISTDETVHQIKRENDYFLITTDQTSYYGRSVLLTSGQGVFEPRKLTIDYKKEYEKTNLHYYVQNLDCYRNKEVAILGGGDSAVDWALMLEEIAEKVMIIHRRNKFRAHEASISQLKESSIEILTPYIVDSLAGNHEKIQSIHLEERRGTQKLTLPVDYLIVNYGFVSDSLQLVQWGVKTERTGASVNQQMETSIPGIFAAGDAADFPGKVKLIATGFGEVPTAINSIVRYLDIY